MPDKNNKGMDNVRQSMPEFNNHIARCLSRVLHYPEIEEIIRVVKKIDNDRRAEMENKNDS